MKMQKKLNVVLAILIVILVSLVSFGGIFYKNKNEMKNLIPDYKQGTDLKGYRQIVLEPKKEDETNSNEENSESQDEEKSETENESNSTTENTTQEESNNENVNSEHENKENYKKSAEVFKSRLKTLTIDNYSVACDSETGKIEISLPENEQTDVILSDLIQKGKFTIKDSKTGEELLNNSDVRSVKVGKTTTAVGNNTAYMSIYFTTKGTSKFADITKNYQNTLDENDNVEDNAITDETSNETTENVATSETENTTTDESTTENKSDEKQGKQVTLNIDDVTMMTTSFEEIIDNGVLSLNLGASQDQSNEQLYSAYNLAAIIENDALPIEYEVQGNVYVSSIVQQKHIKTLIYFEIGIAIIIMLVLIFKFRIKGLFAAILSVGYLAILLIVVRYANVVISILGIFAIEISYIMNSIFSFIKYSKNKEDLTKNEEKKLKKEILKEFAFVVIPPLIIAIVCIFTQWSQLSSFGMIMFWGITISIIYNFILDKLTD